MSGGPDAPVNLCIRHPISGTYLGFRELAMENKPYALHVKTFTNYTDLVQAVAQDPNAIGYTAISLAANAGVKPRRHRRNRPHGRSREAGPVSLRPRPAALHR